MATKKVKNCCRFSRDENKLLIECVKSYPALYDKTQEEYKCKIVRDLIWQKIGKTVKRSDCKTRWRTIRDLYNRKIKENMKKTGSPIGKSKSWEYMEQMSFLKRIPNDEKPSDQIRNQKSVISTDEIIEIIEKESEETMDLIKKNIDPNKNKMHPIELFFDNMAKMVIEFPHDLAVIAKYEVCKIVTNLEYDSLSYSPKYDTRSSVTSPSQSYDNYSSETLSNKLFQCYINSPDPPTCSTGILEIN
ncbi:uncharacterized protein LOC111042606 [Myzus persicae]|uniref:uncharacterized protein LOC111042606 n=1 Tax=Myzus persicae TaxID=13164 RepID=UPI000B936F04|nr:uncharacterized protein LOC111042606 [Myzus persicae]